MSNLLNFSEQSVRNVGQYTIGKYSIVGLSRILDSCRGDSNIVVFFIDIFFKKQHKLKSKLGFKEGDYIIFVETIEEPTTDYINSKVFELHSQGINTPAAIVGMGGGITMDIAKAISNLLTNGDIEQLKANNVDMKKLA